MVCQATSVITGHAVESCFLAGAHQFFSCSLLTQGAKTLNPNVFKIRLSHTFLSLPASLVFFLTASPPLSPSPQLFPFTFLIPTLLLLASGEVGGGGGGG